MKYRKKLLGAVLAVLWIWSMSVTAYAHDVPRMDQTGTISITLKYEGQPVGGGTLTMYRVGEVQISNGNYTFQPTGDFASCGESFEDVTSSLLAEKLAAYAGDQKISGVTKAIGKDGKIAFSDLEVGLYLFVQNQAASGYNKAKSFLVSMPYMQKDGTYTYEVDASPKVSLDKPTVTPTDPTSPPKPSGPTLPQTGQLNWPIPVLTVLGLMLFGMGWFLRFGKEKQNET